MSIYFIPKLYVASYVGSIILKLLDIQNIFEYMSG
jgi:hypothetical protein